MRAATGLAALVVLLACPVAHADAPGQSPMPLQRPGAVLSAPSARVGGLDDGESARPLPRPLRLAAMMPPRTALPGSGAVSPPVQKLPAAMAPPPQPVLPGDLLTRRAGGLCGVAGLSGQKIPPITSSVKGCGLPDGVQITAAGGIPLSIPAEVDCPTAIAMNDWVTRSILPAVGTRGGGLARIEIAGSYSCRPRNNQPGAQISEHGKGHAIDVSGLRLRSGEVIMVETGWRSGAGALLHQIHDAACGPFGTVLGPDADSFHHDHIHVDTGRNRTGRPFCQ